MAVTSFSEIHDGRSGAEQLQGNRSIGTYTRVFRAKTNSNADDAVTIKDYASCPKIGDAHPNDGDAYVRSVMARNEPFSKTVWNVEVGYSTESELSNSPYSEPAEITWSTEAYQRPYFKDQSNQGIVNSAGDPYDPPVEGDDSRWVANVTKNVAAVPSWLTSYRDAVNSGAFTLDGLAIVAGAAKIMSVSIGKWEKRSVFWYRTVGLTIAIDGSGWAKSILDAGFREIMGTSRVNIKNDGDGEDITAPVPLDGSGAKLTNPSASNVVFRTHNIYPSKDFSVLPLT